MRHTVAQKQRQLRGFKAQMQLGGSSLWAQMGNDEPVISDALPQICDSIPQPQRRQKGTLIAYQVFFISILSTKLLQNNYLSLRNNIILQNFLL